MYGVWSVREPEISSKQSDSVILSEKVQTDAHITGMSLYVILPYMVQHDEIDRSVPSRTMEY